MKEPGNSFSPMYLPGLGPSKIKSTLKEKEFAPKGAYSLLIRAPDKREY